MNETSCFFADGDGEEVEHGHYFEAVGSTNPLFSSSSESLSKFKNIFTGGDFTYDSDRRKVSCVLPVCPFFLIFFGKCFESGGHDCRRALAVIVNSTFLCCPALSSKFLPDDEHAVSVVSFSYFLIIFCLVYAAVFDDIFRRNVGPGRRPACVPFLDLECLLCQAWITCCIQSVFFCLC